MFGLLRQRNFSLLWFGQLLFLVGDWVLLVALPFYVYDLTGSALLTGVMWMVESLPRLLLGSLAGVFVDRWDRRRTMIVADLTRALILLPLLLVHSREWLWVIYVVAFLESVISQFFVPAKGAIIPRLVSEKDLIAANSLNAMSDSLTRLIGPSLGGALLGLLGLASVALFDVASYLISGVLIFLITLPPDPKRDQDKTTKPASKGKNIWSEWLEGLRLVQTDRTLAALFLATALAMLGQGLINVLIVVFVKDVLHGGALQFGWMATAQGVGGLVGGLIIGRVGNRLQPSRLITLGLGTAGFALLAIVNFPSLPLALGLLALMGIPLMGYLVSGQTLMQTKVTDQYRGRVLGAYATTVALLMLVGLALASTLGDALGVVPMMNVAAGLYLLAGVVALVMMPAAKQPVQETARREIPSG